MLTERTTAQVMNVEGKVQRNKKVEIKVWLELQRVEVTEG